MRTGRERRLRLPAQLPRPVRQDHARAPSVPLRAGDPIDPVRLWRDGSPVSVTARVPSDGRLVQALWSRDEIRPGNYQLIARSFVPGWFEAGRRPPPARRYPVGRAHECVVVRLPADAVRIFENGVGVADARHQRPSDVPSALFPLHQQLPQGHRRLGSDRSGRAAARAAEPTRGDLRDQAQERRTMERQQRAGRRVGSRRDRRPEGRADRAGLRQLERDAGVAQPAGRGPLRHRRRFRQQRRGSGRSSRQTASSMRRST